MMLPARRGTVARRLATLHVVASELMAGRSHPSDSAALAVFDGNAMRVLQTGRIRHLTTRNGTTREMAAALNETVVLYEPSGIREAAKLGLGIALLAVAEVLSDLEDGCFTRLLPDWYADDGGNAISYASRSFLSAKIRVFIDWIDAAFKVNRLPERFDGQPPRR